MRDIPIPKELSHLKIDERGYPIPFFVAYLNGKPDFRLLDERKQFACIETHLCSVCGKKLPKDYHYFIAGPTGLKNRISTDPPMHRICAEFSLMACPHLYFKRSERRETGVDKTEFQTELAKQDKPEFLLLVKSSKFKITKVQGFTYLKYNPVSNEKYIWENNKLTKA